MNSFAVDSSSVEVLKREERTPILRRASLLIHIGYHKTGTTWLQTGLFQDEKAGFTKPWDSKPIRDYFVLANSFEFDVASACEFFQPDIAAATQHSLLPVMSDERLSGSPHAGGYDSALIADRLAMVFPDARILIVIREQRSAIYSVYQQYVRNGGAASLKYYLSPRHLAEAPQFRFSHFEYHNLIKHYFERFGRMNVLVLPYEWLQHDPERFLREIAALSGLNNLPSEIGGLRYASLGAATVALKRWANFIFVRNALNPSALFYVKNHEQRFERLDQIMPKRFSQRLANQHRAHITGVVGNRYARSNRETAKLIGVDLESLGYSVN